MTTTPKKHPAFVRAEALSEPLRSHFPKSPVEAEGWEPLVRYRALSSRVLVVARTRVLFPEFKEVPYAG